MQRRADHKNLRYKQMALAITLACGMGAGSVLAQSTSGSIYGTADPGAQVSATNEGNGAVRTVTVGQDGR
jgi:hypothetical protein